MKKFVVLLLLLLPISGNACISKLLPDVSDFGKYHAIFTGEVTGIHLIKYEKYRLEALESKQNKYYRNFSDKTLEHEITIVVNRVITGNVPKVIKVIARGCGIHLPQMKMDGVFFMSNDGNAIPVYGIEGQYYSELLVDVGKYAAKKAKQH